MTIESEQSAGVGRAAGEGVVSYLALLAGACSTVMDGSVGLMGVTGRPWARYQRKTAGRLV